MLEIPVLRVFFLKIFLMWIIFKVFIEFVTVLLLFFFFFSFKFCLFVCFLVEEHLGSSFPDQGSNLYPLHWKEKSATGLRGRSPS